MVACGADTSSTCAARTPKRPARPPRCVASRGPPAWYRPARGARRDPRAHGRRSRGVGRRRRPRGRRPAEFEAARRSSATSSPRLRLRGRRKHMSVERVLAAAAEHLPPRSARSRRSSRLREDRSRSARRRCSASGWGCSSTACRRCANCCSARRATATPSSWPSADGDLAPLLVRRTRSARRVGGRRAPRALRRRPRRPRRDPRRELPRVDRHVLGGDQPRRDRRRAERLVDRAGDPLRPRGLRAEGARRRPQAPRAARGRRPRRAGRRDRVATSTRSGTTTEAPRCPTRRSPKTIPPSSSTRAVRRAVRRARSTRIATSSRSSPRTSSAARAR